MRFETRFRVVKRYFSSRFLDNCEVEILKNEPDGDESTGHLDFQSFDFENLFIRKYLIC